MLGIRLRYQISGFLFLLFTMVISIMGYFNVTILNDQLSRFAEYQAKINSEQVYSLLERALPNDLDSIGQFIHDKPSFNNFLRFSSMIETLRNIDIYDKNGKQLFSKKFREDVFVNHQPYIEKSIREKAFQSTMWAVDPKTGVGEQIKSYGILESRMLLSDYYYPIIREGNFYGLIHISLHLERTTRLIKFFFLGNMSLALIFFLTAFIAIYVWSENAINRPIRNLLKAQERLRYGDFDAQVEPNVSSTNELYVISNSFNDMAREIKNYQERLKEQTRKLEQVNEQRRRLNETLEQEVEKKTLELKEFFSLVTHDLKIPLAAIKGYTELLQREKTGKLNEKQEVFIHSIETATQQLLGMVKNMLDSVKYDDGRVEYFNEEFDLRNLVSEVLANIHPIINDKNISCLVIIPDECRLVKGDRNKIGQVFSNILSNAMNYTPGGGEISITAAIKIEDENLVEVRIRDTGKGIPPEQLPIIFNKFQQVPGRESPSTSLGLGLYIVKKIIEGHGMTVWAESTEGKGSSFYFTLENAEDSSPRGGLYE